jgi:hypothetical protein
VAGRYREMQGLVTMSDAMFPVMLASGLFISSNDTVILWYAVGCLVCFVAFLIWLRPRLLAHYTARFGRISPRYVYSLTMLMPWGLTAGSILTEMHLPVVARCLVIFLLLGGWPAWIVARDWPYRAYWAIPLSVAAGVSFPLSSRPIDGGEIAMATCWVAMGATVALAGWFDHRLLVRTLTASLCDIAAGEPTR